MTRWRKIRARPVAAVLLILPVVLGSIGTSNANPRDSLDSAEAKLGSLQHQFEVLVEDMNTVRAKLSEVEARLADSRQVRDEAQNLADRTRALLSDRAVAAYVGAGSQLEGLLGAEDFADFTDRLQYAGALAQEDADLAVRADTATERAQWAADQYSEVANEQRSLLEELEAKRAAFEAEIDSQRDRVATLEQAYRDWQEAQRAEELAAEDAAAAILDPPTGGTGGAATSGGGGGSAPPANASAAQIAIAAAREQIGVTYVWGAMSPGVAFDCSGLTAYAWGEAGVYLPHSSVMQEAATPDVSRDQLQPGDLLFFYSPISHVSLYIGNGQMIDASHPGPGGEVAIDPVYWDNFVVGGRPG